MINYQELMHQPQRLLALTSLTAAEFQHLLSAFARAYAEAYRPDRTLQGQPRQRWPGGGRRGALTGIEDKLLFVLVYVKTYPLQVVLGELFGISTSQAHYWLQRLLPVLRAALDRLGVLPERDGHHLAQTVGGFRSAPVLIIDGTERRRQGPKSPEKQALFYSGKKKAHTEKNVLVVAAARKRVLFLSATNAGTVHDQKIADQEHLAYPRAAILNKDSGFEGYEPPVAETRQAKKKPAGGALTAQDKQRNRKLARIRVRVEHALAEVKRSRIVKDIFRNKKANLSDVSMEAACGLHNLRSNHRLKDLAW